jgi:hypothetical protein
MTWERIRALDEKGFIVLRPLAETVPPSEYLALDYMDWKSGGDTNFAPIASAFGDLECAGFWDHGKPDKDGIWTSNAAACPTLVRWVVRVWLQLTDNPESVMILREDKDDPSTESRIPLPAGAQFVVDSERLYHAVWHPGPEPRYALIVSFESGPALERWIESQRAETAVPA